MMGLPQQHDNYFEIFMSETRVPSIDEIGATLIEHVKDTSEQDEIIQRLLWRLNDRSEHAPSPDTQTPFPLVEAHAHLAEIQTKVAESLMTIEPERRLVEQLATETSLAHPDTVYFDPRFERLAVVMRKQMDVPRSTTTLEQERMRAILDHHRLRLALRFNGHITDNNVLIPKYRVSLGNHEQWFSEIGRIDLALIGQDLLQMSPDDPRYKDVAKLFFTLQQGAEAINIGRFVSPFVADGKSLDDLRVMTGTDGFNPWEKGYLWRVANKVIPYEQDIDTTPMEHFNRMVFLPAMVGDATGSKGMPKLPYMSGIIHRDQ